MRNRLRSSILIFLALTVLTGLAYPLAVTAVAQIAFPHRANGSLLESGAKLVGSSLIGRPFSDPKHLWGRPSATATVAYNASSSSGSNLGPTNPALEKAYRERIAALRTVDPGNEATVPTDLVAASASGLDPDISPAAADFQAARIARARGIGEADVRKAVAQCTRGRQYRVLGEPRVNVLCVNLALDGINTGPAR